MNGLVTVITPAYNAAAFLESTVQSVLAQTYDNVEHIIVDDASSDDTPDILRRLAATYPGRVRVDLRQEREGPCRRRNDAIELARGDLIAWLDHDDIWLPTKLERQVPDFAASDVAFSFCQYEEFDGRNGETLALSHVDGSGDLYTRLFVEGCFVASSTVVFRRDAMRRRTPRLRETDFSFGDDYALWLTLLLDGRAVLVDEVLARLRRHDRNESARIALRNFHVDRIRLLEEHVVQNPDAIARLGRNRRTGIAGHFAAAAAYELDRRRFSRAVRLASAAARRRPVTAARFLAGSMWLRLRQRLGQT